MAPPRKLRGWSGAEQPTLVAVTGMRDQTTRITYLPWADAPLGLLGWEILPDRDRDRSANILVYFVPTVDQGVYEIRCHVTTEQPDPEADDLIGTFNLNKYLE